MTINVKDTRYFWMKSHAVINGVSMTAADKVVYETLHAFASTTGVIAPSVAYISANTALGSATVTRSLKRLEEAKLLVKTKNGNRANSYELDLNELSKLGNGYAERMKAAQEEAAAGKAERMAKLVKAPILVEAINASKHCVEAVLAILRKMTGAESEEEQPAPEPVVAPVVAPVSKWQKIMNTPSVVAEEDEPDWWITPQQPVYNEDGEAW